MRSTVGELSDVKEVLESKKAEVDVLRTQTVTLEESLKKLTSDLQSSQARVTTLESQLQESENSRKSSEAEEITHLRGELARISALVREGLKHEQRVKELEILKKNMESELLKFSFQAETSSAQLKQTKEKLAEAVAKLQEMECVLQKKQLNLDSYKKEAGSFAFQKESMENEVKSINEVLTKKDTELQKKKAKVAVLKSQWLQAKSDLERLRLSSEGQVKELQGRLARTEQEYSQRLAYLEEVALLKQASHERDLLDTQRELAEATASAKAAYSRCEDKESKCAALEEQVLELLQTKKSLTSRLEAFEQEEFKLKSQLESAQRKREQARTELIKLSQKLEQKPSPAKEVQSEGLDAFFPTPAPDAQEVKVLPRLKRDVDLIYKSLMRAMLTAKDVPFPSEDLTRDISGLLMELELFSDVERKVNDLVMNLHEVMDSSDVAIECLTEACPQTWSGRITTAMANIKQTVKTVGPVKLFSCMPSVTGKQPPPMTMKPKTEQGRRILSSTGGDRRVDQQQTPPGWKPSEGYKRF